MNERVSIRLLLYNTILLAVGVLTLPWIFYQLVFVKKRRHGLVQRLGSSPVMEKKTVWCHAVSVGEVRAISPMLTLLENDEMTLGRIVLSTVTLTGQETANRECGFVSRIFYFPLDLPFIVQKAIQRVKPEIFVTAETEIWPNFFSACFRRNIPVVIVNGRISDGSYSRYIRFRWFFKPVLQGVSLFLMQSEEDARRIKEMGARPDTVKVTGNMKYDRVPEPAFLPDEVMRWAEGGFLLVAGSTHAGEEEVILESINGLDDPDIFLALVPRHPERFTEVAALLEEKGLLYARYTRILDGDHARGNVLLVDAMGVLDGFYALADVAFVGGSLVPVGGHNLLEPAMHGVPVITGPNVQNFREMSRHLTDSGACILVKNKEQFKKEIVNLKNDTPRRKKMGARALDAVKTVRGASISNASSIIQMLESK